jgi:RNA polymerase sigma factor (sigma-70 family)
MVARNAEHEARRLANLFEKLKTFYRRRGHTVSDAEDFAQDVLLRLLSPKRTEGQKTDAYAFTVACNLQRDEGRRLAVRRKHGWSADVDIYPLLHPANDAFDAERVLIGKEEESRLMEGLAELNERTRAIFLLYRLDGISQREIASQFGISVSAVEKQVAKAMLHLTNWMDLA